MTKQIKTGKVLKKKLKEGFIEEDKLSPSVIYREIINRRYRWKDSHRGQYQSRLHTWVTENQKKFLTDLADMLDTNANDLIRQFITLTLISDRFTNGNLSTQVT